VFEYAELSDDQKDVYNQTLERCNLIHTTQDGDEQWFNQTYEKDMQLLLEQVVGKLNVWTEETQDQRTKNLASAKTKAAQLQEDNRKKEILYATALEESKRQNELNVAAVRKSQRYLSYRRCCGATGTRAPALQTNLGSW
jgi:hypothetical protein